MESLVIWVSGKIDTYLLRAILALKVPGCASCFLVKEPSYTD
jgi:hypothetical protein